MRTILSVKESGRINYTGLTGKCTKGHFQNEDGAGKTFRLYKDQSAKAWIEANFCGDFVEASLSKELANLIIKAHLWR